MAGNANTTGASAGLVNGSATLRPGSSYAQLVSVFMSCAACGRWGRYLGGRWRKPIVLYHARGRFLFPLSCLFGLVWRNQFSVVSGPSCGTVLVTFSN